MWAPLPAGLDGWAVMVLTVDQFRDKSPPPDSRLSVRAEQASPEEMTCLRPWDVPDKLEFDPGKEVCDAASKFDLRLFDGPASSIRRARELFDSHSETT